MCINETLTFLFSHMQKVLSIKKKKLWNLKTDLRFQVKLEAEARKSFQSEHVWINRIFFFKKKSRPA